VALRQVTSKLAHCTAPIYHAIGNHELYNFRWDGIRSRLQGQPDPHQRSVWQVTTEGVDAGALKPFRIRHGAEGGQGWTFLMLNAYAVSVEQEPTQPGYGEALALLAVHNPGCHAALASGRTQGIDFFAGVTNNADLRFVPFNGGFGTEQREWLRAELRSAVARGDRIVVMSHLPLYEPASSPRTLAYDADEVLSLLRTEAKGHVAACFAGHLHHGGYARDADGIHHVTLPSPLNYDLCFGHVDVYDDRLELHMVGEEAASRVQRTLELSSPPPTLLKCVLEAIP